MIGAGTFAEVFLCQHIASGQILAVKKIRKDTIKEFSQASRLTTERAILGASASPWLVKLYYAFTDLSNIYLAMVCFLFIVSVLSLGSCIRNSCKEGTLNVCSGMLASLMKTSPVSTSPRWSALSMHCTAWDTSTVI